jgi:hypothetical protein
MLVPLDTAKAAVMDYFQKQHNIDIPRGKAAFLRKELMNWAAGEIPPVSLEGVMESPEMDLLGQIIRRYRDQIAEVRQKITEDAYGKSGIRGWDEAQRIRAGGYDAAMGRLGAPTTRPSDMMDMLKDAVPSLPKLGPAPGSADYDFALPPLNAPVDIQKGLAPIVPPAATQPAADFGGPQSYNDAMMWQLAGSIT